MLLFLYVPDPQTDWCAGNVR